jgi:RNA polymerase sigma factor (sigma-70 family)
MYSETCSQLLHDCFVRYQKTQKYQDDSATLRRLPKGYEDLEEAFDLSGIDLIPLHLMTEDDLEYFMSVAPSYEHISRELRKKLQSLRENITPKPRKKLIRPDDLGFCGSLLIACRKFYLKFKEVPKGYKHLVSVYRTNDVKLAPLEQMTATQLKSYVRKGPSYSDLSAVRRSKLIELSREISVGVCTRMHDYLTSIGLDIFAENKTIISFALLQSHVATLKDTNLHNSLVTIPRVLYSNPYKHIDLDQLKAFASKKGLKSLAALLTTKAIKKFVVNKGPVSVVDLRIAAIKIDAKELIAYLERTDESLSKVNSLAFFNRIPFVRECLEITLFTVYPYLIQQSNKMQSSINNFGSDVEDKFQEMVSGFLVGMLWWDPTRDNSVTTYGTYWSKQHSIRSEIDTARTVRYPVHVNESFRKLRKAVRLERVKLHKENPSLTYQQCQKILRKSFAPTLQTILVARTTIKDLEACEDFDFDKTRINDLRAFGEFDLEMESGHLDFAQHIIELDEVVDPTHEFTLLDLIQSPEGEIPLFEEQRRQSLEYLLKTLTPMEEKVIYMRYLQIPNMTLTNIGTALNLSRERVRQVEAKALQKVRRPNRADYLRGFLSYSSRFSGSIEFLQDQYFQKSLQEYSAFENSIENQAQTFEHINGSPIPENYFDLALFLLTRENSTLKEGWFKKLIIQAYAKMTSGTLGILHPHVEACQSILDMDIEITDPSDAIQYLYSLQGSLFNSTDLIERYIGRCLLAFANLHPTILLDLINLGAALEIQNEEETTQNLDQDLSPPD